MKKSSLAFTQMRGTSHIVGGFFERLACLMLNGEDCPSEQGDLVHLYEPSFIAEVKASDNTHVFRISKPQLVQQKEQVGFVIDHHLYLLFKYKNKEGRRKGQKRRLSLIKKMRTPEKVHTFLASSDLRVHILDRTILEAIERRFYSQKELPLGLDGQESIWIGHKTLEKFSDSKKSRAWFQELGLKNIKVCNFCLNPAHRDGFLETRVRITVTTVLPGNLSREMQRVFFLPKIKEEIMQKTIAA